ncbi:MAG: OB-fold nucleic acid binding domain-containing protein [Chloroflexi bacterium]|nr:OB-fold nucleic acid binding domain-containing protein [Chloroflexota bacterium]MCY3938603.1 OB-fold nucleic acid binding domain-containing protein [Chloroflexota bacterium]
MVEAQEVEMSPQEGKRRKRGLDSIGAPRARLSRGHPRNQTASALQNAFDLGDEQGDEARGRYGEHARRTGNSYDGMGSGVQAPGLGDAAIPRSYHQQARTGVYVKVAGIVINRQRPETARGFVFMTLEDETGLTNVVVKPDVFKRYKHVILDEPVIVIYGELEDEDTAIHVRAERIMPLDGSYIDTPPSHDWH